MSERRTPSQFISDLLRAALTDPNAVRRALGTNWIYPDKPRLKALSGDKNNFPRLSITEIDVGSEGDMGMAATETYDKVLLSVTAWCYGDDLHSITVGSNDAKVCSGHNLAEAIIQNTHIWLRENWRDQTVLMDYEKSGTSPYLEDFGGVIKKYTMTIKFKGVNIGD
jgi:hypothetical protein